MTWGLLWCRCAEVFSCWIEQMFNFWFHSSLFAAVTRGKRWKVSWTQPNLENTTFLWGLFFFLCSFSYCWCGKSSFLHILANCCCSRWLERTVNSLKDVRSGDEDLQTLKLWIEFMSLARRLGNPALSVISTMSSLLPPPPPRSDHIFHLKQLPFCLCTNQTQFVCSRFPAALQNLDNFLCASPSD